MKFNVGELDEIIDDIEFSQGLSINDINIDGFREIYEIISNQKTKSEISSVRIFQLIQQVELYKLNFEKAGCIDLDLYEKIIKSLEEISN